MLSSRIRPVRHRAAPPPSAHHAAQDAAADAQAGEGAEGEADAESLLSAFLPHLFPDDTPVCLGDPGQALEYASPRWGPLRIWVPDYGVAGAGAGAAQEERAEASRDGDGSACDGAVEASRKLFAHYLWGGALVIADEIERRSSVKHGVLSAAEGALGNLREETLWDVEGQDVLELGAGAALPSLIALRAGARSVTITDHPSAKGIYGPIQQSLAALVSPPTGPPALHSLQQKVTIQPYTWGACPSESESESESESAPTCSSASSPPTTAELAFATAGKARYSRVICADCLWMPEQHDNLARSIAWFLAPPPPVARRGFTKTRVAQSYEGDERDSSTGGAALVVAGFHTGRDVVASFFEEAVPRAGLLVERIYERDLHARAEDAPQGRVVREWRPARPGESDRSRWCVVALVRRVLE
ncbi:hypothetical protein KEM52_003128 [Ascosphaera acerosa]|nr:hypothetical protein KEM52_003128 [Ascosphaera acerosa]